MAVVTPGRANNQASATWAGVASTRAATRLTASITV